MKGLKAAGLGFIAGAAVAFALGVGPMATPVAAQDETISIGSATVQTGDEGSVDLDALDMPDLGLGAWTIDIAYDPDVVSAVSCQEQSGSVCNPFFDDDTVRVTGANASGLEGDTKLASITFECKDEGSSSLELTLQVLADATPGDPQDIDAATEDGSVACVGEAPVEGAAISIGSATVALGDQGSVDLEALDMPEPGLGAWTIDVTYDPDVVTAVACIGGSGALNACNPDFEEMGDTVRVTGVDADGLEGDATLATITFECEDEGYSSLELDVQVLVDATVGEPKFIEVDTKDGSITCTTALPTSTPTPTTTTGPTQPAATATATPTATAVEAELPTAGVGAGGGWDGGNPLNWFIAGLVGAGIAWLIAGLAGAGVATVGGSGAPPLRPTEGPGEATFTPAFRSLRMRAREESGKAATTTTSGAASRHEAGAGGAGSGGGSALNWLISAREQLASAGLAAVPGFGTRRRPRRP